MYLKILNEHYTNYNDNNPKIYNTKLHIEPFRRDCNNIAYEIDLLEKRIGWLLPNDYKLFLLKYNGGDCVEGNVFVKHINPSIKLYGGDYDVKAFLGFNNYYYDLNKWIDGNIELDDMGSKTNNINGMKSITIATTLEGNDFHLA